MGGRFSRKILKFCRPFFLGRPNLFLKNFEKTGQKRHFYPLFGKC